MKYFCGELFVSNFKLYSIFLTTICYRSTILVKLYGADFTSVRIADCKGKELFYSMLWAKDLFAFRSHAFHFYFSYLALFH